MVTHPVLSVSVGQIRAFGLDFLSPRLQIAQWTHMHRFLSVRLHDKGDRKDQLYIVMLGKYIEAVPCKIK